MKIISADFVTSAARLDQCPGGNRPEVAFVGRSNVGKSSLMNALLNRKGLAKTSGTPGKTQTINFFDVNNRFYFVDLPGYGYAKVPKTRKSEWNQVMTAYLRGRTNLRLAVQLIDSRHAPTDKDLDMLELLEDAQVATVVVATKVDKLKSQERVGNLAAIRTSLDLDEDALLIPFSTVTGEGVRALWDVIQECVEAG